MHIYNNKMHIYKKEEWRASNLSQTPIPTKHFKMLYACKLRLKNYY